ncbi:hypothetical protein O181_034057 [Austropuccinia psidii MF-1]|uniref:Uncharacterized protein n=1 Tax=Austropuccinia psidii MF-1 TaxID=1389203 RepID=A0A9Q3D5V6_9BASI|nr:hypothetical protein [Austropuccinia psidii MF-1]
MKAIQVLANHKPFSESEKIFISSTWKVFSDIPAEDNQTTFERLVEETIPTSPPPIVIKKKKAEKLDFPGPTIQYSEEEVPNTPSNQMELDLEVELIPQKGKEREKSPVEQNPHKEVPYPKGKSHKCP